MKRILLLGKFVILWALFLNAQELTTLRIGEIDVSGYNKGDKIVVPVYCDNLSDDIGALQLYITYDQSVLDYQKVSYIHPKIEEEWRDNNTENFWAAVWISMTRQTVFFNPGDKICELEFIYVGGQTDLVWGKENETIEGRIIKGETKIIDLNSQVFSLNLINGCVCNLEKE